MGGLLHFKQKQIRRSIRARARHPHSHSTRNVAGLYGDGVSEESRTMKCRWGESLTLSESPGWPGSCWVCHIQYLRILTEIVNIDTMTRITSLDIRKGRSNKNKNCDNKTSIKDIFINLNEGYIYC